MQELLDAASGDSNELVLVALLLLGLVIEYGIDSYFKFQIIPIT